MSSAEYGQLLEFLGRRFDQVDQQFLGINQQLAGIDQQFLGIDQQFLGIDQQFAGINQQFAGIDRHFARINQQFLGIDQRFTEVARQFAAIGRRLDEMDHRFSQMITDLRQEMLGHFDAIYHRFERLEQEYQAVLQALRRIEARLTDEAGRREILERDLAELRDRVAALESRIDDLEQRLGR